MAAFSMSFDQQNQSGAPRPRTASDVPVADLSHLYNEPDPRAYYAALGTLDYQTPDHIQKLARWCCGQRQEPFGTDEIWAIDIGCGYATNAAGLRNGIAPQALYSRYRDPTISALDTDALHHEDHRYFSKTIETAVNVAGIDTAHTALTYGVKAGLLKAAFSDDLTQSAPSPELADIVTKTTVIMESGVPIFILPYILDSILSVTNEECKPWLVTAPPRYTDLSVYREILMRHGYVLQHAHPDSLPHRRFFSEQEKADVIAAQTAMGLDNKLEEKDGYVRVELLLARPECDAEAEITFAL